MSSIRESHLSAARALACALAVSAAIALLPATGDAMTLARARDLADLSLEQLTEIVVTSVSRREQRLGDAPASVYVITGDDIRRSGAQTLPEALRLAPNLQIARADANQYVITARGFGNVLANKLLVMIDGRTVYSPLFSGVFWDAQDVMLEDVDRIEVIDGPGATLWGTNAVNGVINIITRPAHATQRFLASGGGGNRSAAGAARYGGVLDGGGHYRVYARTRELDATRRADGSSVDDASRRTQAGFRADREIGRDAWTVQGDVYTADVDQGATTRALGGGNLLARWQRTIDADTAWQVQAYYDRTTRNHPGTFRKHLDTVDVEAQAGLRPAERHALLVGGGYRYQRDRVENSAAQAFVPDDRNLKTAYVFVQDEIALHPDVDLIAGLKAERNDYTGVEWLPNLRLRWHAAPAHMVWASVSRAVRAPSRIDRELFIPGAPPFFLVGDSGFRSEVSNVFDAGLRGQPHRQLTYSLTAFHHDHDRLRSLEPVPGGGLTFANGIEGRTTGLEGWTTFQPTGRWRLSAGGMLMRHRLRPAAGSADQGGLAALGNDPRHHWLVRSSFDIASDHELDLIARHTGSRPQPVVPAHTTLDVRWGWRMTRDLELSVTLTNLTDAQHPEWGPAPMRAEIERMWFVKLLVRL